MHLASASQRGLVTFIFAAALAIALSSVAAAGDRVPLIGTGSSPANAHTTITPAGALILPRDPSLIPCMQPVSFTDLEGGPAPGTNFDGVVVSGGMLFAERFAGQSLGSSGDFDLVSGAPSNPLTPQAGAPGQNLDVFDYAGNVLAGLGPIGYPDIDAIGEGSIAMVFPLPQSQVKFDLVGGNGGSATLSFYRANGTLIDDVTVSGLADLTYGFATADATASIAGILVQNTDASGIGVVKICYDAGIVSARAATWGRLKQLYR